MNQRIKISGKIHKQATPLFKPQSLKQGKKVTVYSSKCKVFFFSFEKDEGK